MSAFIPKLYYYEHCPYCIRVLCFAGQAGVVLDKAVLLNDDEATPIRMAGIKSLPILEKAPQQFMNESLDIIDYLCQSTNTALEKDGLDLDTVAGFLADMSAPIYHLTMPRWATMPFKEFATPAAVDYFIKKKTASIGDFAVALAKTETFSKSLNQSLVEATALFESLLKKPSSLAAIMLFSGLHGVSGVKGFPWTVAAERFMVSVSEASKVALLTGHAR